MSRISSLQNRRDFLRISGEEGRRRGKREASAKRELRAREVSLKNPAFPHTIVQAVPAFKYERNYLIGYLKTRDPRMFFQDAPRPGGVRPTIAVHCGCQIFKMAAKGRENE